MAVSVDDHEKPALLLLHSIRYFYTLFSSPSILAWRWQEASVAPTLFGVFPTTPPRISACRSHVLVPVTTPGSSSSDLLGFNQPIMCGGEPRVKRSKERGGADLPIYSLKIQAPRHAVSLIFSFTNGIKWYGSYKLQFEVLRKWTNKPPSFFNEGLAEELGKEGACEGAIFPDSHVIIESCEINNLYFEGGDRCRLDLMPGCMDPNSPFFDPLANVDDGSCPLESDSEE